MTGKALCRLALACFCALLVLSACGAQPTTRPAGDLKLLACSVQKVPARCGRLTVPENPSVPGGRKISLSVVVVPALSSNRAPDPLFYLAGGPGGAATDSTQWAVTHFKFLHQRHDIVLVDQRGTGGSGELSCPLDFAGPTDAAISAGISACLASIKGKADPLFYTTPISVDDFDQVRAALGYDKIDVYGISYGVSTGLAYIQQHGAHVRAALLDSGSLLNVHLWERVPISAQHAIDELFARCTADAACSGAFPNVQADFGAITTRLAAGPIQFNFVDPQTHTQRLVPIELATLLNLVIDGYLANVTSAASLPRAIHAAARGDWTAFIQQYLATQLPSSTKVMTLTTICSDDWARFDTNVIAGFGKSSAFTPAMLSRADFVNTECKYWPRAPGASGRTPSSAPIVFLNGTADPVDPPANVTAAPSTMPNSLVVPIAGFGHGVIDQDSTSCLAEKASIFFDAGRPSTLSSWSCPLVMPSFVTG